MRTAVLILGSGSIFDPIYNTLGGLLAWLYGLIPNFGIAIILLTVLVRLVLLPLTSKQAKSMLSMQRAAPEIKKLQAKYKDDRQKLNEETMKFYRENKINPFGGCLPLVLQMPILIGLFRVFADVKKHVPKSSTFFHNMCNGANYQHCKPKLPFLGMDLSLSASKHHAGFGGALPYFVLVALVMVSTYLQQRQTTRYASQAPNPQMQMVGRIMPIFLGFISINLPAGAVLYFFVSNVWQLGQQEIVYRKMGEADSERTPPRTKPGPSTKSGPPSTEPRGSGISRLLRPPGSAGPTPGSGGNGGRNGRTGGARARSDGEDAAPETPKGAADRPPGRRRSNKKRKR